MSKVLIINEDVSLDYLAKLICSFEEGEIDKIYINEFDEETDTKWKLQLS